MEVSTLHPIEELQGIGQAIGGQLRARRFLFAEDLLTIREAHLSDWATAIAGLTVRNLRDRFIPQALLLQIPHVDGQFAEGLVASGYKSYRGLVDAQAADICAALDKRKEEGLIPNSVNPNAVVGWQLDSARLICTSGVHLDIVDSQTGTPIPDADIELDGCDPHVPAPWSTKTNEAGAAWLAGLLPGQHHVTITAAGYKDSAIAPHLNPDVFAQRTVLLHRGQTQPVTIDEFEGELIGPIRPGWRVRSRSVAVDDLPKLPPAAVIAIEGTQATLCSLLRKRVDRDVLSFKFKVPLDSLPVGIEVHGVLVPGPDGTYLRYNGSTAALRGELQREHLFGAGDS